MGGSRSGHAGAPAARRRSSRLSVGSVPSQAWAQSAAQPQGSWRRGSSTRASGLNAAALCVLAEEDETALVARHDTKVNQASHTAGYCSSAGDAGDSDHLSRRLQGGKASSSLGSGQEASFAQGWCARQLSLEVSKKKGSKLSLEANKKRGGASSRSRPSAANRVSWQAKLLDMMEERDGPSNALSSEQVWS